MKASIIKVAILLSLLDLVRMCNEKWFLPSKEGGTFSSSTQGDYFLQSLMSITSGVPCTHITTGGLLRSFAVKFAIKTNKKLQNKNFTLGYQINDTCLSVPVTMSRGIELANQQRLNTCVKENIDTCRVMEAKRKKNKLLAVIGAYYSFTTVPLSSLLGVYSIPQVSFGASTPLLSKRTDFPSTFRTIPSDEFAVEAMLAVIKHFNWTYIFAVGSDDDYGKLGLGKLKERANEEGICITGDLYISFETEETRPKAKEIAKRIEEEKRATVVVMFNYALGMGEYILEEAGILQLNRIWLTSEAWNPEVLASSSRIPDSQLSSIITISLDLGLPLPSFINYVEDIVKREYKCDIWLHEYIKQEYNCTVESLDIDNLHGLTVSNMFENCSVKVTDVSESILRDNPSQINNLIDAVDSVIYAIDKVFLPGCQARSNCDKELSPKDITEALGNVSFTTRHGKMFSYGPNGNPSVVSYSIEQIQLNDSTNVTAYKKLGNWSSVGGLTITDNKLVVPDWSTDTIPKSTCSNDCQPGERQVGFQGCCWECEICPDNTMTNDTNQDKCMPCPTGYHTKTKTFCEKTPIIYLGADHPIGIGTIILSVIGIVTDLICIVLIVIYKDTEAIKNWSRFFITGSIFLLTITFAYTFIHIIRPSVTSCRIQHILFYLILTTYIIILFLRDKSSARFISKLINSNKENERNSRLLIFVSVFTVELALITAWQFEERFPVVKVFTNFQLLEQCELKFTVLHILCFAYPSFIVVISLIQTYSEKHALNRDRDLKYLHYTCLAFCIINLAYIITVNHVFDIYKAMVTLCTTLAYGYVYMCCMIITKIFQASIQAKTNKKNGTCHIVSKDKNIPVNESPSEQNMRTVTLSRYEPTET